MQSVVLAWYNIALSVRILVLIYFPLRVSAAACVSCVSGLIKAEMERAVRKFYCSKTIGGEIFTTVH